MNANPRQALSDARADLAGLVPAPAERDLPSDRHRSIQELFMDHVQSAPDPAPRRAPRRRLILASALTVAVAATATAVLIGGNEPDGSRGGPAPVSAEAAGREILLAAATSALRTPDTAGTYWHVRTESSAGSGGEKWIGRDGGAWFRQEDGEVEHHDDSGFFLGRGTVSFQQLQTLPTEPEALRKWISDDLHKWPPHIVEKLSGFMEALIVNGLLDLVTELPTPPQVRAAAFQALAASPGIKSTGVTEQGQGLLIERPGGRSELIIDTDTGQVRKTVSTWTREIPERLKDLNNSPLAGTSTTTAEWTDRLPR